MDHWKLRSCLVLGSEADAAIFDKAIELKQQLEGLGWGESGGSLVVASGGDVQPAGSLRLLLIAEPGKISIENLFKIPRSLTFCTDVEIVHNTGRDITWCRWGDSGRQHWLLPVAYVPVIGLRLAVAEIACDWPETGRGRDCL